MQKTKSTISIRWKLLAFLLAFVILILGIITILLSHLFYVRPVNVVEPFHIFGGR